MYSKQLTEAMYSSSKTKSITENIDKSDFCTYYTIIYIMTDEQRILNSFLKYQTLSFILIIVEQWQMINIFRQ